MGDKLAAKRIAAQVGVPDAAQRRADRRGRVRVAGPGRRWSATRSLVKAAAGGGGRGMRLVGDEDELEDAVRSARREALASFGDGTVFAERWLPAPRHIEVQVVADQHGHVIHLGERECSIQRRHQKLVEEAPSTAVDEVLREQLGAAAVELAEAIRYDNVGTVEFLRRRGPARVLVPGDEHADPGRAPRSPRRSPAATSCWWQIQCARGEPLEWTQDDLDIDLHAIEVRLYAEDPAQDWLPSTGRITRFSPADIDDEDDYVVIDTGVSLLDDRPVDHEVTAHFDPLLAKFTARGYDRTDGHRPARALPRPARAPRRHHEPRLPAGGAAAPRLRRGAHDHPVRRRPPGAARRRARPGDGRPARAGRRAAADGRGSGAEARGPSPRRVAQRRRRRLGAPTFRHREPDDRGGPHHHGRRPGFEADVERPPPHRAGHRSRSGTRPACCSRSTARPAATGSATVDDTWYVNSTLGQTDLVELPRFAEPTAAALAGGPTAPVPGRVVAVEVAAGARSSPARCWSCSRP